MTDDAKQPKDNDLRMEVKGNGYEWTLRDGAHLLIRMQNPKSPYVAFILIWQGADFVGPFTGNYFADTFRDRIAAKARRELGEKAPHIAEDLERVARRLGVPQDSGKNLMEELREANDRSPVDRLIVYARAGATFFHNEEQEAVATIKRQDHEENYELSSPRFLQWMRNEYWNREKERLEDAALMEAGPLFEGDRPLRTGLPDVVREQNVTDALSQLASIAVFEGEQHEVYVRTAQHEGAFYYDMGDAEWRAISISTDGWEIVPGKDLAVRFVRPKGLLPLLEPLAAGKGSFDPIDSVLNLGTGEEGKRNRLLILAWLTYCMLPNGPYPIVNISGPQGSAKTTTVKALRQLIDPNSAPKGTKPKHEHDTYIDAAANWVLAYDQLVSIPVWFSNVLCDVATGGGYRTRTLYSNRDQEIFSDTRPIVCSGIGNIASRPDFLQRSLMISLPPVGGKMRKRDRVVQRRIRAAQPEILSALLDATVIGLRTVDSVVLEELPRMADYYQWGCAVEEALGAQPGDFEKAFEGSAKDATHVSLAEWPVTDTFVTFAEQHKGEANAWSGYSQQLYDRLNDMTGQSAVTHSTQWPGSPSALSRQINDRLDPLSDVGIIVKEGTGADRRKKIIYSKER
jgi:hypothetical protein